MYCCTMSKNIRVYPRPDNSPDLNTIENVWSLIKSAICSSLKTADLKTKIRYVYKSSEDIKAAHDEKTEKEKKISLLASLGKKARSIENLVMVLIE